MAFLLMVDGGVMSKIDLFWFESMNN